MIKRKGMTMAIQIVIVIIVLVVLALLVIGITRGQIFGGLGFLQTKGDQQDCLSSRDIYCQTEPTGCWASSEEKIQKSIEDEGRFCHTILGKKLENSYYSCQYREYIDESAYSIIEGINTTEEYYTAARSESEGGTYRGYLKDICRGFKKYWDSDKLNCTKSKAEQSPEDIIDLTFLNALDCKSLN